MLLVDKQRIQFIGEIASRFSKLVDLEKGVLDVKIDTFMALSDIQIEELSRKLGSLTGMAPKIKVSEEPKLLGGIRIRFDDTLLDGSVAGRMKELYQVLLAR
jgi:F-type H+-transporting ATPase subunit delta